VDYNKYSLDELYDIEGNIDRDKFPERYHLVLSSIKEKESCNVALSSTNKVKEEIENIEHQQIIKDNNGAWLSIRFLFFAIVCSYLMFQDFEFYEVLIIIVTYLAFIALVKQVFIQYHLFKNKKLENQIKKTGVRKK
jgi:hypothetical protein